MLLKGSSSVRAGRLLQSLNGHAGRVERSHLAARSLFTASTRFNGRTRPLTASSSAVIGRTLATAAASRPKAHTGRTTSTRKTGTGARGRPAAKRQTTTKRATKAKPKPKPKPKPRRVALTPEAKKRNEIRKLRQELLHPPKELPRTAFTVLSTEMTKGGKGLRPKEASAAYHSLSPAEREHYNHIANENRAKNKSAYHRWIQSHSPTEVKRANFAGHRLAKLGARKSYASLQDPRRPKRPAHARMFFLKDRFASGDMVGVPATEAMRLITAEWKQLSSSQKQKYMDEAKADLERYQTEVKQVYG